MYGYGNEYKGDRIDIVLCQRHVDLLNAVPLGM